MTETKKIQVAEMLTNVCWIPQAKGACPSLCLGYCPFDTRPDSDKEDYLPECLSVSPQDWLDWMEKEEENADARS